MRLVLAFLAVIALAGGAAADGLAPVVPAASGEPHAEGSDWWRVHHMDTMLHGRDLTLREGVRDIKASIGTCFDCHGVKDDAGEFVTFEDPRHFCRVCHDYAAIEVDCFMCHRSTPSNDSALAYRTMAKPDDPVSIEAYLARVSEGMTE